MSDPSMRDCIGHMRENGVACDDCPRLPALPPELIAYARELEAKLEQAQEEARVAYADGYADGVREEGESWAMRL